LRANASKHKNVTYERAGELLEILQGDIAELLQQAEQADTEASVPEGLPEQLQRREKLRAALEEARAKIEARARREAQGLQAEYEAKAQAREQRPGNRQGKAPTPPRTEPEPTAQINLSDEDSRLMRRSKNEAFEQCYNAQAAVCAEGSQLIVGVQVSQHSADNHELEPTLAAVTATVGAPARVLVDSGYLNGDAFGRVMAQGVEVYGAVAAEASMARRRYEYRPKDRRRENPVAHKDPRLVAMREKLASEEGRAIYARRQTSVEPTFGIIKSVLGFRQFLLRGHLKVSGEWTLVALAYNCKRLCGLLRSKSAPRPAPTPTPIFVVRAYALCSTLVRQSLRRHFDPKTPRLCRAWLVHESPTDS
jgi:hypothetical protein